MKCNDIQQKTSLIPSIKNHCNTASPDLIQRTNQCTPKISPLLPTHTSAKKMSIIPTSHFIENSFKTSLKAVSSPKGSEALHAPNASRYFEALTQKPYDEKRADVLDDLIFDILLIAEEGDFQSLQEIFEEIQEMDSRNLYKILCATKLLIEDCSNSPEKERKILWIQNKIDQLFAFTDRNSLLNKKIEKNKPYVKILEEEKLAAKNPTNTTWIEQNKITILTFALGTILIGGLASCFHLQPSDTPLSSRNIINIQSYKQTFDHPFPLSDYLKDLISTCQSVEEKHLMTQRGSLLEQARNLDIKMCDPNDSIKTIKERNKLCAVLLPRKFWPYATVKTDKVINHDNNICKLKIADDSQFITNSLPVQCTRSLNNLIKYGVLADPNTCESAENDPREPPNLSSYRKASPTKNPHLERNIYLSIYKDITGHYP